MEAVAVAKGARFEIRAIALRRGGTSVVSEYLATLREPERINVVATIKWFAEHGDPRNERKCRRLSPNLFELKEGAHRVPFFYDSRRRGVVVLTHGFRKRSDKTPAREIRRAVGLREEYERNVLG